MAPAAMAPVTAAGPAGQAAQIVSSVVRKYMVFDDLKWLPALSECTCSAKKRSKPEEGCSWLPCVWLLITHSAGMVRVWLELRYISAVLHSIQAC